MSLEKVEAFLERRIAQLDAQASKADPRVAKDFDDQADCFLEVLSFVRKEMGKPEFQPKNIFNMFDQSIKYLDNLTSVKQK